MDIETIKTIKDMIQSHYTDLEAEDFLDFGTEDIILFGKQQENNRIISILDKIIEESK
jgi:hypothetical protein